MNRNKLRAIVATGAAAAIIGVAGFAFAAFIQERPAEATSKAAKFAPVVISGIVEGQDLLPGDSSKVTLTLTNPDGNAKAEVKSIVGVGADVKAGSVDPGWEDACARFVSQSAVSGTFPKLEAKDTKTIVLKEGITLGDAPIQCEGMEFTAKWRVTLEPVR